MERSQTLMCISTTASCLMFSAVTPGRMCGSASCIPCDLVKDSSSESLSTYLLKKVDGHLMKQGKASNKAKVTSAPCPRSGSIKGTPRNKCRETGIIPLNSPPLPLLQVDQPAVSLEWLSSEVMSKFLSGATMIFFL